MAVASSEFDFNPVQWIRQLQQGVLQTARTLLLVVLPRDPLRGVGVGMGLGLARVGSRWLALARVGSRWLALARVGSRWLALARVGSRWLALARVGSRWLALARGEAAVGPRSALTHHAVECGQ